MRNDGHCHEKRIDCILFIKMTQIRTTILVLQIKGDEWEDGVSTHCTVFMVIIRWCWVGNDFCETKKQSVVVVLIYLNTDAEEGNIDESERGLPKSVWVGICQYSKLGSPRIGLGFNPIWGPTQTLGDGQNLSNFWPQKFRIVFDQI